ncbi:hypothetical protein PIB30_039776 [Stylosanthes scabra]|uniref:Glabrous enhancer-binding protein-like DBD domain-containing protein n=1 Tax=Stylosanthes scabra TaxID=79078 RepID=A0ABU6VG92_9FABA|nr:hypothetical protein [Stylosanthes scabra]
MAKQKNVTLHENSDDEEPQVPVTQPEEEEDSSEEEEETTSSDEEDDEGGDERHEIVVRKPQPQTSSKPSSSSSEDDSDSEPEPEPEPEPQKVKPSSKAKSQSSTPASQAKSGSLKRGAENSIEHSTQSKRGKKAVEDHHAAGSDEEDQKKSRDESKSAFQRIFSEKDEIGILKGMTEFTSKTGKDPHKCSDEFYEFMKGSKLISSNASCNQLKDKIRRLKKKFENNLKKRKNGKEATLSKPHELEAFNLSKNIWGGGGEAGSNGTSKNVKVNNEKAVKSTPKKAIVPQSNGKPEVKSKLNSEVLDSNEGKEVDELSETSLALTSLMRYDGAFGKTYGKDYIRNGLEKLGTSKREELEGRWRKLQEAENELYVQTAEFYAEQIKLIFQANKSSS